MRIPELYTRGKPVFSFEFFLPKSPEEEQKFRGTVQELKKLRPGFVTMTYGAGGAGGRQTLDYAAAIKNEMGLETAAHLTCITHTRVEIADILDRIRRLGVENVVALRGDRPKGSPPAGPEGGDFKYAVDLVRLMRSTHDFSIGVAGYPEKHPEAESREADLRRLKEKVDAGAHWVMTQLFFRNADYFDFVERARAAGIDCPIVPGIMPVTSYAQLRRFTSLCGTSLPEELVAALEPLAGDRKAVRAYGVEYAARQCRELLDKGAPGIHFYTLNRSRAAATILSRLLRG